MRASLYVVAHMQHCTSWQSINFRIISYYGRSDPRISYVFHENPIFNFANYCLYEWRCQFVGLCARERAFIVFRKLKGEWCVGRNRRRRRRPILVRLHCCLGACKRMRSMEKEGTSGIHSLCNMHIDQRSLP